MNKICLFTLLTFLIVLCNSCDNREDKCTLDGLSFRDISSQDIPLVLNYNDLIELYPFNVVTKETRIVRPNNIVDTLYIYRYPELGLSYFRYGDSVQLLEVDLSNDVTKKEFQLGCLTLSHSLSSSSMLDFFQYDSSYMVKFYREEIPYNDSISYLIFHAFDTSFINSSIFYFTPSGYLRYINFSFANGGIYP